MLNYFPKFFTSKAITLYFAALLVVTVLYMSKAMSLLWWIFGAVEVVGFFYFSNQLTRRWANYSEKKFSKKLFQTGLILRATDELRILVSKSMNEVFKTIVPHLSTPYKEDLSYDGMRSKSYVAEDRDKQIAIETLERIIKKIKQY